MSQEDVCRIAFFAKGNDPMALREITTAIELQSRNACVEDRALAHFYRGSVLVQLGNVSDAAKEFETAVRESPNPKLTEFAHRALSEIRPLLQAKKEFHR